MTGVLVVDDQSMVREGFAALLDAQPDLHVLGTAGDGQEAVDTVRQLATDGCAPDVVLMDVRMPSWTASRPRRSCCASTRL
jgi:YesN/AraC family two-component response regulator